MSALGLDESLSQEDAVFVVVSHDCDLAERSFELEPIAEVVEGVLLDEANGNFMYAKSPRTLHLPVNYRGENRYLALRAVTKRVIDRGTLELYEPDQEFVIKDKDRILIGRWQAARYNRAALPNALIERFKAGKVLNAIESRGKSDPEAIAGIFIDYDPGTEISNDNEPYELWISVVYLEEKHGAAAHAERIAKELREIIENKYKNNGQWRLLDLQKCEAISDLRFSLNSATKMKMIRLDHISNRHAPALEIPEI